MNEVVATTDQELWAAVGGGDVDEFGVLFERHSRAVYNFAFRWTADWAAAEDTASEVFSDRLASPWRGCLLERVRKCAALAVR
jgi:DNA-directed RNA polymerase specialized sigma24 family protein